MICYFIFYFLNTEYNFNATGMGKGEKGGFGGRSHGIGHSSFGHSRSHGIGHSSFGHHHHGMGHSSFGHRSYSGGGGITIKTFITDPNWENEEPSSKGKWKGELCDFCYSPGDFFCACQCCTCYSLALATDIGMH